MIFINAFSLDGYDSESDYGQARTDEGRKEPTWKERFFDDCPFPKEKGAAKGRTKGTKSRRFARAGRRAGRGRLSAAATKFS